MKASAIVIITLTALAGCAASQAVPQADAPLKSVNTEPAKHVKANADVVFVKATQSGSGTWRFDVSVSHPDTGWDDYADGWDVLDADGQIIKAGRGKFTRTLAHPHVNQSPFTRSQSGLRIKDDIVTVRAHDMVDGYGGQIVVVDLTKPKGKGFTVKRKP